MLFSSPEPSSLLQHVRVLYPLAQVLVGADKAEALVRQAYKDAAAVPPSDRPEKKQEWLVQLLLDARHDPLPSPPSDRAPDSPRTDDAFRRDIADRVAQDKLPVAFASCAVRERFILTVDALTDAPDDALADALDTTPPEAASLRERARSTLRASLRDVLTGPERMLVDVALPDDALRSHLRTILTDRFDPAPPAMRSEIADIMASASSDDSSQESSSFFALPSVSLEWVSSLRQWMNSGQGIAVLVTTVLLLVAGLGGASLFIEEPTSPATDVVDVSVRNAPSLAPTHATSSPDTAAAYIQRTWARTVSVPTVKGASLQGVGRLPLTDSATVPVLLYTDPKSDRQIATYAFNYALLDQSGEQAVLDRSLRTSLATPDTLLPQSRSHHGVVLWRTRDDIFVTVAPELSAKALRSRLQP